MLFLEITTTTTTVKKRQGRDLKIANTQLIEKRIQQWPQQSFVEEDDRLCCQACKAHVHVAATTVKRHLGTLICFI